MSIGTVGLVLTPSMAEQFPPETRSAGIALTYALIVTIFGATTQFVIAWLIGVTGDPIAPAYYLMAAAALSIVSMAALGRLETQQQVEVPAST